MTRWLQQQVWDRARSSQAKGCLQLCTVCCYQLGLGVQRASQERWKLDARPHHFYLHHPGVPSWSQSDWNQGVSLVGVKLIVPAFLLPCHFDHFIVSSLSPSHLLSTEPSNLSVITITLVGSMASIKARDETRVGVWWEERWRGDLHSTSEIKPRPPRWEQCLQWAILFMLMYFLDDGTWRSRLSKILLRHYLKFDAQPRILHQTETDDLS